MPTLTVYADASICPHKNIKVCTINEIIINVFFTEIIVMCHDERSNYSIQSEQGTDTLLFALHD